MLVGQQWRDTTQKLATIGMPTTLCDKLHVAVGRFIVGWSCSHFRPTLMLKIDSRWQTSQAVYSSLLVLQHR